MGFDWAIKTQLKKTNKPKTSLYKQIFFVRRKKQEQRQMVWNMRMTEQDQMADLMKDQHRERILEQISREKNRQYQEQKMVELSREAKKNVRWVLFLVNANHLYLTVTLFWCCWQFKQKLPKQNATNMQFSTSAYCVVLSESVNVLKSKCANKTFPSNCHQILMPQTLSVLQ